MRYYRPESRRLYCWAVVIICLLYFITQCCYLSYAHFYRDDFWLAYHTTLYKKAMPYRDFAPYKSVLGYYVLLMPMYLFHGVVSSLLSVKIWVALINTLFLTLTSVWLSKFFAKKAILLSLVIIISTPLFIMFSSEIRTDVLSTWFCLISVLFLFEKKYLLTGASLGLAFLISQKAVWYMIATDCGIVVYWLMNERTWKMVKNIALLNISALCILAAYIMIWSYYSSIAIVLRSLFYEPYIIASVDWYANHQAVFWTYIIGNSLGIITLLPIALIGLMILPAKNRTFIIPYALVILFFMLSCKQAFPYFPLIGVPAFLLVFCAFLSALNTYVLSSSPLNKHVRNTYAWMILSTIIMVFIWSPWQFVSILPTYNSRYQKSMLRLMDKLLENGGSYIAGVPLLVNLKQPVPGLENLVGPAIDYLHHQSKKLQPLMTFPSQNLVDVTVPQLITSIQKAPVKIYVDNNRFHKLPKSLQDYLHTQYKHFWGSVFLYAPQIQAGEQIVDIKFAGNYKINTPDAITLNNKTYQPNTIIPLLSSQYRSKAQSPYQLELIPNNIKKWLTPEYKKNKWKNVMA